MPDAHVERKSIALVCLVLALGTVALYWPLGHFPFILYDDEQYVTGNRHVVTGLSWENFKWAFTTGEAANWHPLTWLSHQADCALFGLNAGRHHLVNVLMHTANALLLFAFLRTATGALWRSALVAALFAWHPLHVESVAWASERKDVLSTFFFLLTLIAYARYANAIKNKTYKAAVFYVLALFLFACGLMSKPMVVTLPFVLLLLDGWPLARIEGPGFSVRGLAPLVVEKIPFFVLAAVGSAVTYLVQSGGGAVWRTPWLERLANAAIAYASYVLKIFRPTDLGIVYSHPKHWPFLIAGGAVVLLLVWTIPILLNWRRCPYLAVGWFWFLGTLVPTIGIVQVGAQYMADRYSYIPSIGFFIVVVWGGWEMVSTRPQWKNVAVILAGVAVLGCCVLTSVQLSYWRDNVSLFRHAIEVSPDNYIAANCLGKAYEKIGDNEHALVLYQAAVEAEPRFPQSQFNYAIMLLAFGDKPKAFEHLEATAELEPHNADVQYDLGQYFSQAGNLAGALRCFSNCVVLRPDYPNAQFNFGAALVNLGDPTNAAVHFREALRLQPNFPEASNELRRIDAMQKGP
jgi:tetratricopeptide (TPR) repeat protein